LPKVSPSSEELVDSAHLTRSLELMSEAQRIAKVGSWVLHIESGEIEWSNEMYRITGHKSGSYQPTVEGFLQMLHPDDREHTRMAVEQNLKGNTQPVECRLRQKKGGLVHVYIESRVASRAEDGSPLSLHGTMLDISARKRLEAQLLESQKMQDLGKLAGGVAHDLNNYLQILTGNVEILQADLPELDANLAQSMRDNQTSLSLCSSLTSGLLSFSRQQSVKSHPIDAHLVIEHSIQLVRKLLGPDIELRMNLHADEHTIFCDPNQLQQVLFNLLLNARDAMGGTGVLEVSTSSLDEETLTETQAPEGQLCLSVKDSGCGICEQVRAHIFEPFFTTKPEGHGTGLGLSTTFGIVEQMGGLIAVESELGKGSTFRVHVPVVTHLDALQSMAPDPRSFRAKAPIRVLVVDDEPMVRRMAVQMLTHAGYQVSEAENGLMALERVKAQKLAGEDDYALIVSDVVMPQMNGAVLAETLREEGSETPILLMSGYAERDVLESGAAGQCRLLNKPFSQESLLETTAYLLERPASDSQR